MTKIPVLATIRAAYGFTFQNLGSIIGLIWLPMVVLSVTGFFALQNLFGAMIDYLRGSNPAAMGPAALMTLAYLVVVLLLYAVMYSAVTQLALGTRQGNTMMHFALGAVEWRLFRAFLALTGLVMLLMLAALLTATVAQLALSMGGLRPTETQSGLLMMFAFYGVMAIAVPRFLLLLPAVAAQGEDLAMRRAWALSAGNFAGLLAIAIAVFAPGLIIMQLAEMLVPGAGQAAASAGQHAVMLAALEHQRATMPVASGIAFFIAPLTIGLVSGASVAVHRALAGDTSGKSFD